MDKALACCAGGLGSIPTVVGIVTSWHMHIFFLPLNSSGNVVGKELETIIGVFQRFQNA